MTPPIPKSWRILASAALVLAAGAIALSAYLFTRLAVQQDSINQSRVNITYRACKDLNQRHDRTLAKLDRLIAALPDSERKRAQRGAAGSKAIIEALAPHQDCRALVRSRFGSEASIDRRAQ